MASKLKKTLRLIMFIFRIFTLIFIFAQFILSQTVPVTFYYKPQTPVNAVFLAGSFNNWGNNVNGIVSDTRFKMNYDAVNDVWYKVENLGIGTHEYKFVEDRVPILKVSAFGKEESFSFLNLPNFDDSLKTIVTFLLINISISML